MKLNAGLTSRARTWGIGMVLGTVAMTAAMADAPTKDWPMFGRDLANTASTTDNEISTANVGQLQVKWSLTTGGDVSARAAVVNGVVYFPDWGGNLWAVAAGNGKVLWSHQLAEYGLTGSFSGVYHSRTTPAIVKGTMYVGTQEGAWLLAIDAKSGALLWKTRLETADPYAIVTTSPSVHNGVVYTGLASTAEGASLFGANLTGLMPRGSAVAVNAATGAIQWKTYMVPTGYSGGGVWGSHPVVDPDRNSVFVSTGNNYTNPTDPAYIACVGGGGTPDACSSPNNFVDAVVALDLTTGAVKWASKLVNWNQGAYGVVNGSDDWNVDCLWPILGFPGPGPQCPSAAGPDYDFGSAPNLITYQTAGGPRTIIGAGQKSGIYYALDPDTGAVVWQTQVGPGSALGGMEWGSASDGQRIYVQIANLYGIPHGGGSAGSWSALDPATGQVLWQTADPSGAVDIGPMTVANGVVYASSMAGASTAPTMLALNAATGQILWSFAAGSSVNSGATVVDGTVFWGSGYAHLGFPGQTGNNKFYAFKPSRK